MQAAPTFSHTESDGDGTASGRVTILRCEEPGGLGAAVRDCVFSLSGGRSREIVIPTGPYKYAYAAALYIADQIHTEEDAALPRSQVLNRVDIAALLRPLVRANVVLGIPRLDQIDPESVQLLASLAWFADLCSRAGVDSSFALVAGITAEAPSPAMRRLLQLGGVQIADVDPARLQPPAATPAQRQLLSLLAASPHPLPLHVLASCAGKRNEEVQGDLTQLAAAAIIDLGDSVGQGPAFSMLAPDPDEIESARQVLLDRGMLELPDARLAVVGPKEPRLAIEMGYQALERGEPEIAARCFRYGGSLTKSGSKSEQIAYAVALADSGALEGASAIFASLEDHELSSDQLFEFGVLAFKLWEAGVLPRARADQAMRLAERTNRAEEVDRAVHIRNLRGMMMLRYGEAARAMTLMRRVVREQLEGCKPRTRIEYQIVLSRAYAMAGSRRFAEKALTQARGDAVKTGQRMDVERAFIQALPEHDALRDDSLRRAVRIAAENLDAMGAQRLLPARPPEWLGNALSAVFSGGTRSGVQNSPDPNEGPAALFGWLRQRGATLLAVWAGGELQVFPVAAANRVGLAGWMQLALQRMREHPGVTMSLCHAVPGAGPFAGEVIVQIHRWGEYGPAIALFRREEMGDLNNLLAALSRHTA